MSAFPLDFNKPKKKTPKRALRFEINLKPDENEGYKMVDCPKLIRDMLKKRANSDLSLMPGDVDEEEVAATAAYFERKYSRAEAFKYEINKGDGYVDDNSFIDDSEAYDEIIPPEMETLHGGFYINCGQLELVQMPDQDEKISVEFEKAAMLQQLKRKRKGSEFDIEPLKPKKINKVHNKPKVNPTKMNEPGTSHQKVLQSQPQQQASLNKNGKLPLENYEEEVQIIGEKPAPAKDRGAPRNKKNESILEVKKEPNNAATSLTPSSSLTGSTVTVTSSPSSLPIKKTSNTEHMAQMIKQFMNQTPEPYHSNSDAYSKLQKTLINLSVSPDVVIKLPKAKPTPTSNGHYPSEWNKFLVELYNKTSSSEETCKNVFTTLADYVSADPKYLMLYARTLAINPVEVRQYQKPAKSNSFASESILANPNVSKSSKMDTSSMRNSNISSGAFASASGNNNALNLSMNHSAIQQNSGFGEGLASKLQSADRNSKASSKKSSNVQNTAVEAHLKAFYQNYQKSGDKKMTSHVMNSLLAASAITTRPGTSSSPGTNSLLQPKSSKPAVQQGKSPAQTAASLHETANMISQESLQAYTNFLQNPDFLKMLGAAQPQNHGFSLTNSIIKSSLNTSIPNQNRNGTAQFNNPLSRTSNPSVGVAGVTPVSAASNLSALTSAGLHYTQQHFNQNPKSK